MGSISAVVIGEAILPGVGDTKPADYAVDGVTNEKDTAATGDFNLDAHGNPHLNSLHKCPIPKTNPNQLHGNDTHNH